MDNEIKIGLKEVMDHLKGGWIIHVNGYVNKEGEVSNVSLNGNISYENSHNEAIRILKEIAANKDYSINVTRHTWKDKNGVEHTRNAKNERTLTKIDEVVKADDPDMIVAIEELMKSLTDPKKINTGFEKISNSLYENSNTDEVYLRNVFVLKKDVITAGDYPITCSQRKVAIKEVIEKALPTSKYRTYTLKEGKYSYISACRERISSSSSSED